MTLKATSGRLLYGASVVTGALALAEFVFLFAPKIRPLAHLLELLELYLGNINPAFKGLGTSRFAQLGFAVLLAWLASYIAIEAFSRYKDGLSLWRNISFDSCGLIPRGTQRTLCTASKWTVTVIGAPLLILWALVVRTMSGMRVVTVGFVTVNPDDLVDYVKHLALGLAIVVSIAIMFLGPTAVQY